MESIMNRKHLNMVNQTKTRAWNIQVDHLRIMLQQRFQDLKVLSKWMKGKESNMLIKRY